MNLDFTDCDPWIQSAKSGGGGVMEWEMCSWHTMGPLIPNQAYF